MFNKKGTTEIVEHDETVGYAAHDYTERKIVAFKHHFKFADQVVDMEWFFLFDFLARKDQLKDEKYGTVNG
jgi:hypothetical protein